MVERIAGAGGELRFLEYEVALIALRATPDECVRGNVACVGRTHSSFPRSVML
jgi:hypothetical protein